MELLYVFFYIKLNVICWSTDFCLVNRKTAYYKTTLN